MIRSIEPGEGWAWCYLDLAYLSSQEWHLGPDS